MDIPKRDLKTKVKEFCKEFGGMVNAHSHGDRAHTNYDKYYESTGKSVSEFPKLSLPEKQQLTWRLHKGPGFKPECIEARMKEVIQDSINYGVRELVTTVDVTYNSGHSSLDVALALKKEYSEKGFGLTIGAYNPSGFKNRKKHPDRFEIFESAAAKSDFLMGLAEKDRSEEHIGEHEHNFYMLQKAYEMKKPVHFHVGQENRPTDRTLEILLDDLEVVQDNVLMVSPEEFPEVVAVHAISTSCYGAEYINEISKRMAKRNVKLISCPRAAISMLQDGGVEAPIHNSIAPIWRMAVNGVDIKGIGTDNIDDIFMPEGTTDLMEEVTCLASAQRYYGPRILAKVACGKELDPFDRATLAEVLKIS